MLKSSITLSGISRILTLICVLMSWDTRAQHFMEISFDAHVAKEKIPSDSLYLVTTNYITTGICLRIDPCDTLDGSYMVVDRDTFYFHTDLENVGTDLQVYSNLYTSPVPVGTFLFYPGTLKYAVGFVFINAQMPDDKKPPLLKKKSADCSEPIMIDQSEWRQGLPEPVYERIPNEVHNVIIHHSAGSNSDTNYIQVVRNIYIYHTEIRGWSDIGYNYLIAQDGTLFKGRDPDTLDQDNVLGAHFCNSNTGTMGICILGNYLDMSPPDKAFLSLTDLVTWKLGKDSLDPVGMFPHPLNPELHVIAGHRDGCTTECPGDSLYLLFVDLRRLVMDQFLDCGYMIKPVNEVPVVAEEFRIIMGENEITICGISFYKAIITLSDLSGRSHFTTINRDYSDKMSIPVHGLSDGLYILSVRQGNEFFVFKIMLN